MNPEYDPSFGTEIIYHDKKCLFNSCEVELLIIKHVDNNCNEIFAYDSDTKRESNRLYLNSRKIRAKLNRKDIEERVSVCPVDSVSQEVYLEHLNYVISELTVEFIIARLHSDPVAFAASQIVLFLSSTDCGEVDSIISTLNTDIPAFQFVVKPEAVIPYRVNREEDNDERGEVNGIEGPDSSAEDSFNDDHSLISNHARPSNDSTNGSPIKEKTKLQCLSQKKSFSCCNDINILWEEKLETGGVLSIRELLAQQQQQQQQLQALSQSNEHQTESNNRVRSAKKEPTPRRGSFDSVTHLAAKVLAPLFPDTSGTNKIDAGITPKRRSTFSMFQTVKGKPMHGENYKTSMKLEPLEGRPSEFKTPQKDESATMSPTSSRFSVSNSTMKSSRSGSDNSLMPGHSPHSMKGSPLTPVAGRKAMKKISHHNIKNYLT